MPMETLCFTNVVMVVDACFLFELVSGFRVMCCLTVVTAFHFLYLLICLSSALGMSCS